MCLIFIYILVFVGVDVERYYCCIENNEGEVILYLVDDVFCVVNGMVVDEFIKLI